MNRFAVREGWMTVALTALIVYISVASIQHADWADGLGILSWIMVAGLIVGFTVSKWRRLPPVALHLLGALAGLVVVILGMTAYLDDSIGGNRDKLRWLWDRGEAWVSLVLNGETAEDLYLFILFISVLTFLMAYLTMWFVFRARWVWAAIFFPGLVLLLNLGYSLRVPTSLVVFFMFASLLLLMRFSLLQRELNWRRVRIEYPSTLIWRGFWVASYLAVIVILFGWTLPLSAKSATINTAWNEVNGPWKTVENQFNNWFVGLRGPSDGSIGGFAAFDDGFELGGPLSLSDDPVVLVEGEERPTYLQAHTYDVYTGRGWDSSLAAPEEGAEEGSDQGSNGDLPPQYELQAGESLPLDSRFTGDRERTAFDVEIEKTRGSILFSPGAFVSADVGANLVVSWRELDETIDVHTVEQGDVPAEVWPLIEMLRSIDLTPPEGLEVEPTPETEGEGESEDEAQGTAEPERPMPDLSQIPGDVRELQNELIERDIQTSYQIDPEAYNISLLSFSGEFPNLNDSESAYARDGLDEGDSYQVEAMVSDAMADDLARSGQDYPESVTERYLDLPDSVTDRTRALASDLASGHESPYDISKEIENYLRENITYDEAIDFPPQDVDVVDHVIFTSQRGYCEYYASAFVVMARALDIPARMSVGFFPTDDQEDDQYVYRERNAHAWPEVYFPGYGWVGFEPTAARDEIPREPQGNPQSTADEETAPILGGEGRLDDGFNDLDQAMLEENENLPTGEGVVGTGQDSGPSIGALAMRIVPLAMLLGVLILIYLWLRGTRGLSPTNQMYTKLWRGASWSGLQKESSMTPNEYADVVSREVGGSQQPVSYLTDLFVRETYSQYEASQSEIMRARHAWLRLRGLLLRHIIARVLFWRGRRRDEDNDDW